MHKSPFSDLIASGDASLHTYGVDMLCPYCEYYAPANGPELAGGTLAVICYRCHGVVMIRFDTTVTAARGQYISDRIVDYYPKRKVTVDPQVPKDIAEDYLEAQRCFIAGCWHASAVMGRRCMHMIAEHFNAV